MVRGATFNKKANYAFCEGHSKCDIKCLIGKGTGYCSFIIDAMSYGISNISCPRYEVKDNVIVEDRLGFHDGKTLNELVR